MYPPSGPGAGTGGDLLASSSTSSTTVNNSSNAIPIQAPKGGGGGNVLYRQQQQQQQQQQASSLLGGNTLEDISASSFHQQQQQQNSLLATTTTTAASFQQQGQLQNSLPANSSSSYGNNTIASSSFHQQQQQQQQHQHQQQQMMNHLLHQQQQHHHQHQQVAMPHSMPQAMPQYHQQQQQQQYAQQFMPAPGGRSGSLGGGTSGSLGGISKEEKRSNHNAIERARRETLNIRFLELAQALPALVHVRKPSKGIIVARSIDYITEAKQRLDVKNRSLQLLRQQNEEYKLEINRLRQNSGMDPYSFPDAVDLDLVFEANLEQQREMDRRMASSPVNNHSSGNNGVVGNHQVMMAPQQAYPGSSYRNNSTFDLGATLEEEEDDRFSERGNNGFPIPSKRESFSASSLLSPLTIGERNDSIDYVLSGGGSLGGGTPIHTGHSHSLLGNALENLHMRHSPFPYQGSPQSQPQSPYPTAIPTLNTSHNSLNHQMPPSLVSSLPYPIQVSPPPQQMHSPLSMSLGDAGSFGGASSFPLNNNGIFIGGRERGNLNNNGNGMMMMNNGNPGLIQGQQQHQAGFGNASDPQSFMFQKHELTNRPDQMLTQQHLSLTQLQLNPNQGEDNLNLF